MTSRAALLLTVPPCLPGGHPLDLIDDGHRTKDCLLAIARAELDLGRISNSRGCVERVLKRDPTNEEALALHHEIRTIVGRGAPRHARGGRGRVLAADGPAMRADGPMGLVIAAGAVVVAMYVLRRVLRSRAPPPSSG